MALTEAEIATDAVDEKSLTITLKSSCCNLNVVTQHCLEEKLARPSELIKTVFKSVARFLFATTANDFFYPKLTGADILFMKSDSEQLDEAKSFRVIVGNIQNITKRVDPPSSLQEARPDKSQMYYTQLGKSQCLQRGLADL